MKKPLQSIEYTYASARVRALETHMVGRERINALIEAKSTAEVLAKMAEYGIHPAEVREGSALTPTGEMREEMLLGVLRDAYREVEAAVPDAAVFRWFRYPYDCNNIKAAMKCHIRGIQPDGMLFDFGTVPATAVMTAVREGNYAAYPPAMAAAAPRAKEAYAKTGDPCKIDTILDRACYEDMVANATESLDETLIGWLKAKIDLVNVMICVRILRMKRGDVGLAFLKDTLLSGGTLEPSFFVKNYDDGEEALWNALRYTPYGRVCAVADKTDGSLARLETCLDDHWMNLVREGAKMAFGAAVPGGYLIGCETSVKNMRIVLAGKDAGLSPDAIRERIRVSYV